MALIVNLKFVENLQGKFDRQAKLTFRGKTHETTVVHSAKRVAYFGQSFDWPLARPAAAEETLKLQLYNYNKFRSSKLVGIYELGLQTLIQTGELNIDENLVDANNRVLEATINFEVQYNSPDGQIGTMGGAKSDFGYPVTDNYDLDNVDFGMGMEERNLYNMSGGMEGMDDDGSMNILMDSLYNKKLRPDLVEWDLYKERDFQVNVTVIEGQQLAGLDIDPVVKVSVGDQSRYTGIRQSNNCPYYNDYFVFEFKTTPAQLLDKMVTITAYHAYGIPGRSMLRAGNVVAGKRVIGLFKCDIATVYSAPDHQFYHRWAVLLDPKDVAAGPKGYVKCDISVCQKGEIIKAPGGIKDSDTKNIEGNLLLPAGVPMARQRAIYSVFIYRGEDLPRTDLGIMASMQKAITRRDIAFIDAFIQVSFAGHSGKTSVRKSYRPQWNEVLRFYDMLPPLSNRIMIQIRDKDAVSDDTIATHFIELAQIMDPSGSTEGILPTFGPNWLYFYGAPRSYKFIGNTAAELNDGAGEGCAYRGRVLISITTDIEEAESNSIFTCRKEQLTSALLETGQRKGYLLFFTLFEASMINKQYKDKPIYFEISIGKYGNTLDGKPVKDIFEAPIDLTLEDEDEDEFDDFDEGDGEGGQSRMLLKKQKIEEAKLTNNSITIPRHMSMIDENYGYLPLNDEKPCLYVMTLFEDFTRRLFASNLLDTLTNNMADGVTDLRHMFKNNDSEIQISRRLKGVMQRLHGDCEAYLTHWTNLGVGLGAGKTKLDQHRRLTCQTAVDKAKSMAARLRRTTTAHNIRESFKEVVNSCRKLQHLCKDPQHSMPDVLLWMICDKERVAYYRFPAKDLLFSSNEQLCGKLCGERQTVFLKKPGKKALGPGGWSVQAKLNVYLWLGETDMKTPVDASPKYMEKLPKGYELIYREEEEDKPPAFIQYQDIYIFQLRAHIYQARSLIGSDSTGLSDPFARVIVGNHCRTTQIIHETLCPTWSETLVIDNILLYGLREDLISHTPLVTIEIFDYDKVGEPEYLGRAVAVPRVKLEEEGYDPAPLEWFDIMRDSTKGGELLASFELLEGDTMDLPPLPEIKALTKEKTPIFHIPPEIAPTTSKYRLEVLFRGVHDLKRVQLQMASHPRIVINCGQSVITSKPIEDIDRNTNFDPQVEFIDLDLPDNMDYWPPIFLRCMDGRSFGRDVLIGSCTIDHIDQYVWLPPEERQKSDDFLLPPYYDQNGRMIGSHEGSFRAPSVHAPSEPAVLSVTSETSLNDRDRASTLRPPGTPGSERAHTVSFSPHVSQRSGLDPLHVSVDVPDNLRLPGADQLGILNDLEGGHRSASRASAMSPRSEGKKSSKSGSSKTGSGKASIRPTGGTLGPDGLLEDMSGYETDLETEKARKEKYRELIADLDWWNKYYQSREDIIHEEQEMISQLQASNKTALLNIAGASASIETYMKDTQDFDMNMIDYSDLNIDKLKELEAEAKKRAKELAELSEKNKRRRFQFSKILKMFKRKKNKVPGDSQYAADDQYHRTVRGIKGYINRVFDIGEESEGEDDQLLDDIIEDWKNFICRPKFFGNELEKVKEYGGFREWFHTFQLYRGKKLYDEDDTQRHCGLFKGNFCIYKVPEGEVSESKPVVDKLSVVSSRSGLRSSSTSSKKKSHKSDLKLMQSLPPWRTVEVKVIVYIIKATELHPLDFNGKADPYLVVKCGTHKFVDKENRVYNQLNPVFGRMFEFDVALPLAAQLKIEVWDYDATSADDLIGETSIDLENRFFSRHRATCGLQQKYELYGYNLWRDPLKPTEILEKQCKKLGLNPPLYRPGSVEVGGRNFRAGEIVENEKGEKLQTREHLALEALKGWQDIPGGTRLVPEHIEMRSLYCNDRPGKEQGKLEMWVDMFSMDAPLPTVLVDIKPRQAQKFELRCIIWNTDEVSLDDTNVLTGEKSSDIFVKGYLKGVGEDDQQTDVHYRSLTGEGNFNWRFIYPFEYLKAEDKIVFRKKDSIFEAHDAEYKVPPTLTLQIWDADLVSADDFLGSLALDLNCIPKPAKNVKKCTLKMLNKNGRVPTLNLFKNKRCKGWWPVAARESEEIENEDEDKPKKIKHGLVIKGKVEAEIQLLTEEEAEKDPAGYGREEPKKLPEPKRPDTSFLWFLNPLKSLKYILWRNYKHLILKIFIIVIVAFFFLIALYEFPGAVVNRIVNL